MDAWPAHEVPAPDRSDSGELHIYERWTAVLLAAVEGIGLFGTRLLDVGCGTGLSVLAQLERGFEVTAIEPSPALLAQARQNLGDRAVLIEADLRRLPHLGEFDLIWSINDAVNHLLGRVELETALRGMKRSLAPGGVVVICANTLAGYRGFWSRVAEQVQTQEIRPAAIVETTFQTDRPTVPPLQRHFPEREMLASIAATGLQAVRVLGEKDWNLSPNLDEDSHTKAVYVCTPAG